MFYPPFNYGFLRRSGVLGQPTIFWRRSAYEAIGDFDESLQYVADCDYWLRAARTLRFAKVREFLAIDRNQPASKRMSQAGAVKAELGEVRRRHLTRTDMQRARHQLDLTYNFGWRRINIADFLLQEMKMRADIAPAAWRNFLRHQDSTTHFRDPPPLP